MVYTYSPKGQTPILDVPLTRDHLSAISAVTEDGHLYMQVQEESLNSRACVRFLKHLQRQIQGKLLVIWDNASIHKSRTIKDYLADGGAKRLHLERLSGYAPELNPDDGVWRYLKYVELKNVCCSDLSHLKEELRKAKDRLRHKPHIIQSFFRQAGY